MLAALTQYTFVDGDEAERTWHEIIPAKPQRGAFCFAH